VFNLASVVTDGFDFESSYQFSLGDLGIPGDFNLRGLVNHTSKYITNSGIVGQPITESAGNMTLGNNTATNVPLWKGYFVEDYTTDKFSFTLTERWESAGVFSKQYIVCTTACPAPTVAHPTINYNYMPSAFYVDIGGSYYVTDKTSVYFKVDNAANAPPPPAPSNFVPTAGVNAVMYDVIGRMYRVGVRITD
jgi:outer membrane receptor protein involved in Fe transport